MTAFNLSREKVVSPWAFKTFTGVVVCIKHILIAVAPYFSHLPPPHVISLLPGARFTLALFLLRCCRRFQTHCLTSILHVTMGLKLIGTWAPRLGTQLRQMIALPQNLSVASLVQQGKIGSFKALQITSDC